MEAHSVSELKQKRHKRILEAAAQLFSEKGFPEVSFDQIASEADVARRTLYNHFQDKESLFKTLCEPILLSAAEKCRELQKQQYPSRTGIWQLCLELWEEFGTSLKLIRHADWMQMPELAQKHKLFIQEFTSLFEIPGDDTAHPLPPETQALLVYRIFIPLLETLETQPDKEILFMHMMDNLFS